MNSQRKTTKPDLMQQLDESDLTEQASDEIKGRYFLEEKEILKIRDRIEIFQAAWSKIQKNIDEEGDNLNTLKVAFKEATQLNERYNQQHAKIWKDHQYLLNARKSNDPEVENLRENILEEYKLILNGSIKKHIEAMISALQKTLSHSPIKIVDDAHYDARHSKKSP